MRSIDTNLGTLRSQMRSMGYAMDEAEHRLASLEESFHALGAVSKVRQMTHAGLLERIQLLSKQQAELHSLEYSALQAENEQRDGVIQQSHATIVALRADVERLTSESSALALENESAKLNFFRQEQISDEHSQRTKALELALHQSTSEKEALMAELWDLKTQHAIQIQQLGLQIEKSSAGNNADRDSWLGALESLQICVDTFLDEMEHIHKVQSFKLQELNERKQMLAIMQAEVKRLRLKEAAAMASEEKMDRLERTVDSLKTRMIELEQAKSELELRLRMERSKDMELSLTEQRLQVKISVLQGLLETKEAEHAAVDSRVRLVEARNGQLMAASQSVQKEIEECQRQAAATETKHVKQIEVLTRQVVDLELACKNARRSEAEVQTALVRQSMGMQMLEEANQQRDELKDSIVALQYQRDFVQGRLAVSEQLIQDVVLLCRDTHSYLSDASEAGQHNLKQISTAHATIADLQGNQQYLQQLYETRGNELQRLHSELDGVRSAEDGRIKAVLADLSQQEAK
jgi:chromosome segregation ATPase